MIHRTNREATAAEILLIPQILVSSDEDVEPARFGDVDERSILERSQTTLERSFDDMFPAQRTSEGRRCALIEEDVQSASGRDGQAAAGMVKHSIDLVARDAGKPRQEIRYRRAPPFEILKECAHGDSGVAAEAFTTDLRRDASTHAYRNAAEKFDIAVNHGWRGLAHWVLLHRRPERRRDGRRARTGDRDGRGCGLAAEAFEAACTDLPPVKR